MKVSSLQLTHFRLYQEAFFDFDPGINVICGENARGKTSLLEALYFLITGRSFRHAGVVDMMRREASFFAIESLFEKNGMEQKLRVSGDGKERKILYNSTIYPSAATLLGVLRGVVFAPDDAALVKGGPALRRQYLDMQIAQIDPLYVHHLTRYHRAMKQRNTLLRMKQTAAIEAWEHEMALSASYIVMQRFQAVSELEIKAAELHRDLTGDPQQLKISYKGPAAAREGQKALQDYLTMQYHKLRKREMELGGATLTGPHRDDLLIAIGEQEARFFASEGQQRSCVAALKLAEWQQMRLKSDEPPLMLVDDVGISLDAGRRDRLLKHLQNLGQVFLTTTTSLPVQARHIMI